LNSYETSYGQAILGDCLEYDHQHSDRFKLLVADPPWPTGNYDYPRLSTKRINEAIGKWVDHLRVDGVFVTFFPEEDIDRIHAKISNTLSLIRTEKVVLRNRHHYITVNLCFFSRPCSKEQVNSFDYSHKLYHPSREARHLHSWDPKWLTATISHFTEPGDLVGDMFAGTNSVGRISEPLKRKWITVEKHRFFFQAGYQMITNTHTEQDMPSVTTIDDIKKQRASLDVAQEIVDYVNNRLEEAADEVDTAKVAELVNNIIPNLPSVNANRGTAKTQQNIAAPVEPQVAPTDTSVLTALQLRYWDIIRGECEVGGEFTTKTLADALEIPRAQAAATIKTLVKKGFVEVAKEGSPGNEYIYRRL